MESSVAQGGLNIPSLGAPRTFDLFYPELPTYKSTKEISTAVPVIHLHESYQADNSERTAADAFLDMFPQDLLDSNKKIRPIDVRIIEHDGFIDYEIEFIELSEEQIYDYESDSVIEEENDEMKVSQRLENDFSKVLVTTQKTDTTVPVSTLSEVTAVTFVDLLRKARRKHRKKVSKEKLRNRSNKFPLNMEMTESNLFVKSTESIRSRVTSPITSPTPSIPGLETGSGIKANKPRNMVKQRKRISHQSVHQSVSDATPIETLKLAQRFMNPGRSTTFKPAVLTESSTSSIIHTANEDNKVTDSMRNLANTHNVAPTPKYKILPSTNIPSDKESPRSAQGKAVPISDNSQQVDDSSLNVSGTKVTSIRSLDIQQTTEHPLTDRTTTLSLIEELKRQLITIQYDLSPEKTTEVTAIVNTKSPNREDIDYERDDFQLSESRLVLNLHSENEQLVQPILIEQNPNNKDATTMQITKTEDIKESEDDILFSNTEAGTSELTTEYPQPERSPKRIVSKGALSQIIEDSTTSEGLKESQTITPKDVIKGQYHEIHPGQYHEINPGQYHENHPGQYHESNPGQYNEDHPGQYDEEHPGQDLGVDKITVNFDHGEKSRSYNVKANAGDFIIGEVGRIDNNSGQTLEGVRYTAVDGEVDQARIAEILEKYFGAQTT